MSASPVVAAVAQPPPDFDDDRRKHCRACREPSLIVDWAQGDRVCTNCGVVDEGRIRDTRPEWRDFSDNVDDVSRGGKAIVRSGLVPVDETRYVGGLQPTKLSKHVYGNPSPHASGTIRKRLAAANRRIDRSLDQRHRQALESAKLSNKIRRKHQQQRQKMRQQQHRSDDDETTECSEYDTDVPIDSSSLPLHYPELEKMLLQEEQDELRLQSALYADKWSLSRAIRLFGTPDEQMSSSFCNIDDAGSTYDVGCPRNDDDRSDRKSSQLHPNLERASLQLYKAYSMLVQAGKQSLQLPDHVINEAVSRLCQYAVRRDGLIVRGLSSPSTPPHRRSSAGSPTIRLNSTAAFPRKRKRSLSVSPSPTGISTTSGAKQEPAEVTSTKAECRKLHQSGALCAALLFCTARHLGCPLPLTDVCASVKRPLSPPTSDECTVGGAGCDLDSDREKEPFILKRHCSRAMNEVKDIFPDLQQQQHHQHTLLNAGPREASQRAALQEATPSSRSPVNLSHFTERAARRLRLPPVAEASLQTLVDYWQRHHSDEQYSATALSKMPMVCAGMTYLICCAGTIMQRLASQAAKKSATQRKRASWNYVAPKMMNHETKESASSAPTADNNGEPFDVFDSGTDSIDALKQYEMDRIWDAWEQQTPWKRSAAEIEQSCGTATSILDFYRAHIHPQRHQLLSVLKNAVRDDGHEASEAKCTPPSQDSGILKDTPMASVLLPQIDVASSLLKVEGELAL